METKIYNFLPASAKSIREDVFIKEQGFESEYDNIDNIATHLVLFDLDTPVATCRVFAADTEGVYILGRLAVKKEWRGKGVGSLMLKQAEEYIASVGGIALTLHSQLHAQDFYQKCGYAPYGKIEYEQDCPHIWMRKDIKRSKLL